MKMIVHTGKLFLFLALIKDFACDPKPLFILENDSLTAVEGSCVEIRCKPKSAFDTSGATWFWMKDAKWIEKDAYFNGTIVYSTNEIERPVTPDFKNRVKVLGSPATRNHASLHDKEQFNILICDLKINDTGVYMFRITGSIKWATQSGTKLTVKENPCPITFEKPAPVKENEQVTLTCSTLSTCSSTVKIETLTQKPSTELSDPLTSHSTDLVFTPSWKDDGIVFSCQTTDNKDRFLIRNISLTVEYAPKDVQATKSPGEVIEGKSVTLTCSAKGQPNVTFSWFKNNSLSETKGAEKTFSSIKDTDSGEYYCEAENKHETVKSYPIPINVLYAPEVNVKTKEKQTGVLHKYIKKEGDNFSLECNIKRSNPQPTSFNWIVNGNHVARTKEYIIPSIKPEHSGSYACEAKNTVGPGTSEHLSLEVQYKPRSHISIHGAPNSTVKIYSDLILTCNTSANPEPQDFSWYIYNQSDTSGRKLLIRKMNYTLNGVQRTDEACYVCQATNTIGEGEFSKPECLKVCFPPTNVKMSLPTRVREGQTITITCTAESFPTSRFILKKNQSTFQPSPPNNDQNTFTHTFTAESTHNGFYSCNASNTEGTNRSTEEKLVVEYPPKDVKIEAQPVLIVKENASLSLSCAGHAIPPIASFKWMKKNNDKVEVLTEKTRSYSVRSARPSDSGQYSCQATNEIGTGTSLHVEVKIKYPPKHTTITKGNENQLPDGRRFVTLSCTSHCHPPATYTWYNKTANRKVSDGQNLTVYSHHAGELYCTAENDLGKTSSDSIRLFDDGLKTIEKFLLFIFIVIVILLIFFLYRYKKKKSNQQRTTNTGFCSSFLVCWNRSRRMSTMNETILGQPFRNTDDLLPEQAARPTAQRCQPRPDVTSASDVSTVYAMVNLPHRKQAPSPQKPAKQPHKHMNDESLNYASLHFENRKKEPEEDAVYSKVSKPKKEEQKLPDYENVSSINPAMPSYSYEDDTDTSEDEVKVSYTQVNFKPKSDHQSSSSDSSSSEDETQYSQVKF